MFAISFICQYIMMNRQQPIKTIEVIYNHLYKKFTVKKKILR